MTDRLSLPTRSPEPGDDYTPSPTSSPVAPETRRGRKIALAILLLLTFLTVAWIASPLWVGIMLGTMMAFTAQPLYQRLAQRLGGRRGIASGIITAIFGISCILIGFLAIYILSNEFLDLVELLRQKVSNTSLSGLVGERTARFLSRLGLKGDDWLVSLRNELTKASAYAATAAALVLQITTTAMLSIVIGLLTMYYVLLEWPRISARLEVILPLDPKHTRALMSEFRDVARSSLIGTVATAIVQGVLGGIGYLIGGVPHPVTFALLTAIASFLPLVGTAFVWGILPIYMVLNAQVGGAVFVFIWGFVVVMGVSDYVIRPRLVGKDHGHPLMVLLALLGGLELLGLAGLLLAPVLMSLFLAVLRIYEREIGLPRPNR